MSQTRTETDLWGQDIALDGNGQALVAANGELVLTEGPQAGEQDIRLRLFTRLGTLFYDTGFGSLLHDWILEESTEEGRAAFCAEAIMRVEADPRVVPYSVTSSVLKWDERQLIAAVSWRFTGQDQPFNLVMQLDKTTKELIVNDANPDADSFSAHITDN
jgi:phage baseplate assembly protein W